MPLWKPEGSQLSAHCEPADGGSMFLQNICILLPYCKMLQLRRPHSECWKLSVSYCNFQLWNECLFGIVRVWFVVVWHRFATVITNTSDRGTFQCRAKWRGGWRSGRGTTFEGGEIGSSAGQVSGACWQHQTLGGRSEPSCCYSFAWCM